MNKYFVFSTSLLALFVSIGKAQEWSYSPPTGPADWPDISPSYSECGAGRSQSPINIVIANTVQNEGSGLLFFNNDNARTGTLSNNGHFVEFEADDLEVRPGNNPPLISIVHDVNDPFFGGRVVGDHYSVFQIHFHWGSISSQGAEHYIEGLGGLGEVHIIYFNQKYQNFSHAENQNDGVLILAFHLKICSNSAFSGLFGNNNQHLEMIRVNGNRESGISWRFADIYNCATDFVFCIERFYVYNGSLTTPPCSQSVLWWVSDQQLCITDDQLEMLRLQRVSANGASLSNNYRPLQELNGRTIVRLGNATPNSGFYVNNVMMIYLVSFLVLIQLVLA